MILALNSHDTSLWSNTGVSVVSVYRVGIHTIWSNEVNEMQVERCPGSPSSSSSSSSTATTTTTATTTKTKTETHNKNNNNKDNNNNNNNNSSMESTHDIACQLFRVCKHVYCLREIVLQKIETQKYAELLYYTSLNLLTEKANLLQILINSM